MLSAISVQVVIVAMWFLLSLRVEAELLRTGGSLQLETAESDYWFKCRYSEFTEPADQNKDCHQLQSKTVEFEVHLQDERLILQSQLIIIFTYFSQSTWQIRFSPFIYREGYFYTFISNSHSTLVTVDNAFLTISMQTESEMAKKDFTPKNPIIQSNKNPLFWHL